jgi:hypothetical protein
METSAKPAFESLSKFFQLACLLRYYDEDSSVWIRPAIDYYCKMLLYNNEFDLKIPPTVETVKDLLGWDF